jgi:hypothetical protein
MDAACNMNEGEEEWLKVDDGGEGRGKEAARRTKT